MAVAGPILRWEVYWADLDPAQGSEQAGLRPVLIVSNDGANQHLNTVTVLPITGLKDKKRKPYPFEVVLPVGFADSAGDESIALTHQIRTIAKERLRSTMGRLRDGRLRDEIEDKMCDHLGIEFDP